MSFERVRPRKVSAIAAEQIIDAIKRGDYAVDDKLPSESELAEQMGVSRPSIREALSALQALGFVETRSGSGNYVLRDEVVPDGRAAVHLIESETGCLEVIEARSALEPPVVALAARKASPEHLEELNRLLQVMRDHANTDTFGAYFDADKAFHQTLADASGNPLVTSALSILLDSMDQRVYRECTRHYYLKNVDDLQQVVDLHRQILDALLMHDEAAAFAKAREHWDRMREIWEA